MVVLSPESSEGRAELAAPSVAATSSSAGKELGLRCCPGFHGVLPPRLGLSHVPRREPSHRHPGCWCDPHEAHFCPLQSRLSPLLPCDAGLGEARETPAVPPRPRDCPAPPSPAPRPLAGLPQPAATAEDAISSGKHKPRELVRQQSTVLRDCCGGRARQLSSEGT